MIVATEDFNLFWGLFWGGEFFLQLDLIESVIFPKAAAKVILPHFSRIASYQYLFCCLMMVIVVADDDEYIY